MKTFLIAFVLFGAAFALPPFVKNPKIVGGENAREHEAPFMVTLQVNRGDGRYRHTCGGSILNPNWVLSAAHCAMEVVQLDYQIVAGQHNLAVASGREQVRRVVQRILHESFVPGAVVGPFDIMVLRLESPLSFVDGVVGSINLPQAGRIPTGNVQLFGWGSTSQTSVAAMPDILQTVRKDIVSLDLCREIVNAYFDHEPIHSTNVCTGPLNSVITACSGDSGGPIVQVGDDGSVSLLSSFSMSFSYQNISVFPA